MVKHEPHVYLLAWEAGPSARLQQLKEKYLAPDVAAFNLDTVYAPDLTLEQLQERLLCLPVAARHRIVIIKNSEQLKSDVRKFILTYLQQPRPHVILIIEVEKLNPRDGFIQALALATKTPLKDFARLDTFMLSRQVESRQAAFALRTLHQLILAGESPERILGGLRYAFENRTSAPGEARQRLKLLLSCDLEIKTGKLKPEAALQRLLVNLCYLKKP